MPGKTRTLSITAGLSYLLIFFAAIFANFFVLEAIMKDPLGTVKNQSAMVSLGIIAFMITVVFDVVVAWALNEIYRHNILSGLSTLFRMMHAAIMGVGIFALPLALKSDSSEEILHQAEIFNIIWLIGLFFFGIHLILLGRIIRQPKVIAVLLQLAGIMYMVDTVAHFALPNYNEYATIFLALVAIPSVLGEMSFALYLLFNGNKEINSVNM